MQHNVVQHDMIQYNRICSKRKCRFTWYSTNVQYNVQDNTVQCNTIQNELNQNRIILYQYFTTTIRYRLKLSALPSESDLTNMSRQADYVLPGGVAPFQRYRKRGTNCSSRER